MDENEKDTSSIFGKVAIIAVCFILGVLDMIMLRDAIKSLMGMNTATSSLTALCLATIANFTALMWGRESGKHLQKKSVNKFSRVNFLIWLTIGLFYMVIRVSNVVVPAFRNCEELYKTDSTETVAVLEDIDIDSDAEKLQKCNEEKTNATTFSGLAGEVIQIIILAILYSSTGLTISAEARVIFDKDVSEYRKLKKEFEKSTEDIADVAADLQEQIGTLQKYSSNYTSLDLQRKKIDSSIRKAEESTMADIVGKMLSSNPEVTPSYAHQVKNEVLAKRDIDKK